MENPKVSIPESFNLKIPTILGDVSIEVGSASLTAFRPDGSYLSSQLSLSLLTDDIQTWYSAEIYRLFYPEGKIPEICFKKVTQFDDDYNRNGPRYKAILPSGSILLYYRIDDVCGWEMVVNVRGPLAEVIGWIGSFWDTHEKVEEEISRIYYTEVKELLGISDE